MKPKRRRRTGSKGKKALPFDAYKVKCLRQIAELQERMDSITDRKNELWLRLCKQKNSYEARLNERTHRNAMNANLSLVDQVIEMLSKEALARAPKSKRQRLSAAIENERAKK